VLVGGTRKFQVGGDYQTKASVLSRSVGGAKAVIAIEEANRHVTGSTLVSVGGAWNETGGLGSALGVLGASTLAVGGPMSIEAPKIALEASLLSEQYASRSVTAAGKRVESFGGAAKYLVGGSMSLKGSNVYFKATGKIVLQGPGATITITPGAIDIKGTFDSGQASVVTGPEVVG
jgi:type VI secretion system secreted protein VgrG